MVALHLGQVVNHVVFKKQVNVVGRDLAESTPINAFESCPRLETRLLGELLALLLYDCFIFADCFEQQINFESG